ncbi:unnamed protein product [marine sediment metagenome]|uniref:Uncharacterized protein n=1 Tax=marine sediment metagenome TaxID=412755 RepID=X0SRK7_9ZZZZ
MAGAHITLNFTLEHEVIEPDGGHTCEADDCYLNAVHKFTSPAMGSFPVLTLYACNTHVKEEWRL